MDSAQPPPVVRRGSIVFAEGGIVTGKLDYKEREGGFYAYSFCKPSKRSPTGWELVKSWHNHWTHPEKGPHSHDDYWGHKQERKTNPQTIHTVLEDIRGSFLPRLDTTLYERKVSQ
jgi:hypothetical protein